MSDKSEGPLHRQWREEIKAEAELRLNLLNARQHGATNNATKERYHVTYSYLSRIVSTKALYVFTRHAIELEQAAEYMGLTLSDFMVVAARYFMEHQQTQLNGPATSEAKDQFQVVQQQELWELIRGTRSPQFEPAFEE